MLKNCGVVVRASDLQPIVRLLAAPLHITTLDKLFTHMCLCSPTSINCHLLKLGAKLVVTLCDTLAPCLQTCSFGWCLAAGYRNGDLCCPNGVCRVAL